MNVPNARDYRVYRFRSLHRHLIRVAAFCCTAIPVGAQSPSFSLVGAAYDEARGRAVIIGSSTATDSVDTWLWDGKSWSTVTGAGPSSREEPLMVYDSKRRRVLLHGGGPTFNDTWEWNGSTWRLLDASGPPMRVAAALAYDARRDRVVLFGGSSPTGNQLNDTWEWDGNRWTRVVADGQVGSPPRRALHGLAYDVKRGRTVLAGGFSMVGRTPTPHRDTWEWDGSRWRQIDANGPGARDHVAMAYDPSREAVILHGGGTPTGGMQGDTWAFNGAAWTRIAESGPALGRHRMFYDAGSKALSVYGGWGPNRLQSTEMWALRGGTWERVSP
ncbi:MAG: kelch repeat-containing protein [bacterium]